jgi:hypothetical protein
VNRQKNKLGTNRGGGRGISIGDQIEEEIFLQSNDAAV